MEQMTLFDNEIRNISVPLASRVRPKNLDQFVGQQHLIGQGKILRRMIADRSGNIYDILGTTRSRQDHIGWYNSRKDKSEFH